MSALTRALLAAILSLLVATTSAQLPNRATAVAPVVDSFATETGASLLSIPGIADDFVLFADGAFDVRADGTARLSAFTHRASAVDREFYVTLELSAAWRQAMPTTRRPAHRS